MKKIKNIATAGERCFCPGCVRKLPLDNTGCPNPDCGFFMKFDSHIPTIEQLLESKAPFHDSVSPRFFKFLVAYGRATPERQ